MLTFYHSKGSCSDGILYLLHELGAEFTLNTITLAKGDGQTPEFKAMNPKGKVPALVLDDGQTLTEFPVIAQYLARSHPEAGLWPEDMMAQMRLQEMLDYLIATVHMRAFTFVLVPKRFHPDEATQADLATYGRAEIAKGFEVLSATMGDRDYLLGDFSIADTALFFLLNWADRLEVPVPGNLKASHDRLKARPAHAAMMADA